VDELAKELNPDNIMIFQQNEMHYIQVADGHTALVHIFYIIQQIDEKLIDNFTLEKQRYLEYIRNRIAQIKFFVPVLVLIAYLLQLY
jgi:hypothetical protein